MHAQIYLKLHLFPRLPFLTVRSQSLQVRNASRFTSTCEIVLLASHQGAANPGGVDVIAANRTRPKGPLCPEEWLGFQHFANFTAAHFVAKYHAVSELFAKTPSVSPVPEKAIFRSLPTSRTLAPNSSVTSQIYPAVTMCVFVFHQAFMEMEQYDCAAAMLERYKAKPPMLLGCQVLVDRSNYTDLHLKFPVCVIAL